MKVKHRQTTSYAVIGAVLLLILLFIPFPQSASMKAIVTASAQYQVITDGNGGYSTLLRDQWKNQVLSSTNLIPERGTFVEYLANTDVTPGPISRYDTLGWLSSSALMRDVVALKGNINTLKATLEFEQSGSRASVVEAARQELAYAKTRLEEQQKILDRTRSLLESNVITQQEYDLDVRKERLESVRVSIAEANLGAALSGAHSSKLDVYRSQIADEERKLKVMQDVLTRLTLVSPIDGQLLFPMSGDTLLTVQQVDDVVVVLPVQSSVKSMAAWSSDLRLSSSEHDLEVSPDQIHMDERILRVGREQLILAHIRIDNSEGRFVPGQILDASVRHTPKSIFTLLMEMF